MPFNREFAQAIVSSMAEQGWHTSLPDDPLPNPLDIVFDGQTALRLIIHARRLTPQASKVSDHGRPSGEMHVQMVFDENRKGAGARNFLRFAENAQTVLFGYRLVDGEYIIAAYDPVKHQEYAHSTSLQVKQWKLEEAARNGIAFQPRQNDETIVIFPIAEMPHYLSLASEFHNLELEGVDIPDEETLPIAVRRAFIPTFDVNEMPDLQVEERKQQVAEIIRYIRNRRFRLGILKAYQRCAICGFQYDYILDAAHIVPVADGGTDTYDNGLGLCPTCHRMFDKGYILVDANYQIYLNPQYAEEYDQLGLAGSLANLRHTLRKSLWLPEDESYHPSPENLRRTFEARR